MTHDPLEQIEKNLRVLVDDILTDKFGPLWTEVAGLGPDWIKKMQEKTIADKTAQGNTILYEKLISYAEFGDLTKLLQLHQILFKPVFSKWEKYFTLIKIAEELRNTVKHHRDISPAQEKLLFGIAGEIDDAINLWRIGARLNIKRLVFGFSDYIPTQHKSDEEILRESERSILDWQKLFLNFFEAKGLDISRIENVYNSLNLKIKGYGLYLQTSTSSQPNPNSEINGVECKHIYTQLLRNEGSHISLDELFAFIKKQYWNISYDLRDTINIDALKEWSSDSAGREPSSSSRSNGVYTGIEYALLHGKIRIGATNYSDEEGHGGRLQIFNEQNSHGWFPHKIITPQHLLGFITGSVTPRSIQYLLLMSCNTNE
ncbi:MAG: hypothetical protein WC052_00835 [Patescibacteria group bacterium]